MLEIGLISIFVGCCANASMLLGKREHMLMCLGIRKGVREYMIVDESALSDMCDVLYQQ